MVTSIVILTHNKLDYTKLCIESIRTYTKPDQYELIVVDNASTDGTVAWLRGQPDIKVVWNQHNEGFPRGCNQGIEISTGDNILLLNNDTVVTANWLEQLTTALYSSDEIGAVGPATNSAAYYSAIQTNYNNLKEMQQFASTFNRSNSSLWDERLKLIGFCMLIKGEALRKVGLLDEEFSPGNFEDDDYSVRLRKAGYKLLFCKDTFIHHFGSVSWKDDMGSFTKLLSANEIKFRNKWGTESASYFIHWDIIGKIKVAADARFSVLHIGCRAGGTLLQIKNQFPHAAVYGIEPSGPEREEASRFAAVYESLEEAEREGIAFDLAVYTTSPTVPFNDAVLAYVAKHIKKDAVFAAKVSNAANAAVIQRLLEGNNPFRDHANQLYTHTEIESLLRKHRFTYQITGAASPASAEEPLVKALAPLRDSYKILLESELFIIESKLDDRERTNLADENADAQLEEAQRLRQRVEFLLRRLEFDVDADSSKAELVELLHQGAVNENLLFEAVGRSAIDKVKVLHQISITAFEGEQHDFVLPFLMKAYEMDPLNADTLYNIGYILHCYGEPALSLSYLEKIVDQDEHVKELMNAVQGAIVYERQ